LRAAVADRYFQKDQVLKTHQTLATYFRSVPLSARKVEEYPYHLYKVCSIRENEMGQDITECKELQELQVLVDGHGHGSYLLQIFLKDSAGLYQEAGAGPFFYELIQRKGAQGFGAGNFRALFESIEREQEVLAEKGG
jgi:4-hydroxyphenylpyruvate dioxygenase-like putative hemolysin